MRNAECGVRSAEKATEPEDPRPKTQDPRPKTQEGSLLSSVSIRVYLWFRFLIYKIDLYFVGDDAGFVAFGQEAFDAFAAAVAVIEGQVVDPHGDKAVG